MNPVLALILTNTIWGAAPPIFKLALINVPPFTLAFIRFFGASFIFLPFALKHWQKITLRDFAEIVLGGFLAITINITFFFLGLKETASINAPIIACAAPVFLFFLSVFLLREQPKSKVFLGMIIALLGVLLVIFSPILFDGKAFAWGQIRGNLFFLISTLAIFVIHPLIAKNILKRVNPFVVTYIGFLFGSLPFLPLAAIEWKSWSFSSLNLSGWLGIFYGVFLASALAYYLYNYGISKIKAQEIGIFNYIDPVVTVLIAVPLLHEYPSIYYLVGAVLVFGGIFIAEGRLHYHPFHKLKS